MEIFLELKLWELDSDSLLISYLKLMKIKASQRTTSVQSVNPESDFANMGHTQALFIEELPKKHGHFNIVMGSIFTP